MARPRFAMLPPRFATVDTSLAQPPAKVALPFYSSPEWIALRNQVRAEAQGLCQHEGCRRRGQFVDHKVELKDGGAPLDRANVWLLCSSHHVRKTNAVRADRHAGRR